MTAYAQLPAHYRSLVASTPGSVLLETSRPDAENFLSYLFVHPTRTLSAPRREPERHSLPRTRRALPGPALFDEIEQELSSGSYVAGFLSYEFGEQLQEMSSRDLAGTPTPLAWFGVYRKAFVFDHRSGEFQDESPDEFLTKGASIGDEYEVRNLRFNLDRESYANKIAAIHERILRGDTYQVNFTGRLTFDFSGSPAAMFTALVENQRVPYSALIHAESWHILSASPELFFRTQGDRIVARPMKGTARRGADAAEDETIANWLRDDVKNRSENVMIVDLLRNDLGRICQYGSVHVDHLFGVEKYETLFQMVSQISGTLRPGVRYAEIFASLFPCGSVTGAPKLRTMEIIRELETEPRGVYTGAIGFISPSRQAEFNVPIRTVVLANGRGEMGIGSGIVIDSQAEDEFRECLLKSNFLTQREEPFQLIESILWDGGYPLLPLHLERMELSAAYFEFQFERAAIVAALKELEKHLTPGIPSKVRVLLDRSGKLTTTHVPVELPSTPGKVILSGDRVSSNDRFLRHKTTRRHFFEKQREQALLQGYDEVLFLNERGEITEGSISNVFIEKDGRLFTPPLACGVLPGVYRRHLLETNPAATEKILRREDLESADAVYLCNAVRGFRKVTVVLSDNLNLCPHAPSLHS